MMFCLQALLMQIRMQDTEHTWRMPFRQHKGKTAARAKRHMVPLPSYATSQAGGVSGAARPLKALADTSEISAKSPTMVPNRRRIRLTCVKTWGKQSMNLSATGKRCSV